MADRDRVLKRLQVLDGVTISCGGCQKTDVPVTLEKDPVCPSCGHALANQEIRLSKEKILELFLWSKQQKTYGLPQAVLANLFGIGASQQQPPETSAPPNQAHNTNMMNGLKEHCQVMNPKAWSALSRLSREEESLKGPLLLQAPRGDPINDEHLTMRYFEQVSCKTTELRATELRKAVLGGADSDNSANKHMLSAAPKPYCRAFRMAPLAENYAAMLSGYLLPSGLQLETNRKGRVYVSDKNSDDNNKCSFRSDRNEEMSAELVALCVVGCSSGGNDGSILVYLIPGGKDEHDGKDPSYWKHATMKNADKLLVPKGWTYFVDANGNNNRQGGTVMVSLPVKLRADEDADEEVQVDNISAATTTKTMEINTGSDAATKTTEMETESEDDCSSTKKRRAKDISDKEDAPAGEKEVEEEVTAGKNAAEEEATGGEMAVDDTTAEDALGQATGANSGAMEGDEVVANPSSPSLSSNEQMCLQSGETSTSSHNNVSLESTELDQSSDMEVETAQQGVPAPDRVNLKDTESSPTLGGNMEDGEAAPADEPAKNEISALERVSPQTAKKALARNRTQVQSSISKSTVAKRRDNNETFPITLHAMLSELEELGKKDQSLCNIVSWLPNGRSFIIMDQAAFEERIMPIFFCRLKFVSFRRQLTVYGFRKGYTGNYYHDSFIRAEPELARCMHPKVRSPKKQRNACTSAQAKQQALATTAYVQAQGGSPIMQPTLATIAKRQTPIMQQGPYVQAQGKSPIMQPTLATNAFAKSQPPIMQQGPYVQAQGRSPIMQPTLATNAFALSQPPVMQQQGRSPVMQQTQAWNAYTYAQPMPQVLAMNAYMQAQMVQQAPAWNVFAQNQLPVMQGTYVQFPFQAPRITRDSTTDLNNPSSDLMEVEIASEEETAPSRVSFDNTELDKPVGTEAEAERAPRMTEEESAKPKITETAAEEKHSECNELDRSGSGCMEVEVAHHTEVKSRNEDPHRNQSEGSSQGTEETSSNQSENESTVPPDTQTPQPPNRLWEFDSILQHRKSHYKKGSMYEVEVSWKGHQQTTWEPIKKFTDNFTFPRATEALAEYAQANNLLHSRGWGILQNFLPQPPGEGPAVEENRESLVNSGKEALSSEEKDLEHASSATAAEKTTTTTETTTLDNQDSNHSKANEKVAKQEEKPESVSTRPRRCPAPRCGYKNGCKNGFDGGNDLMWILTLKPDLDPSDKFPIIPKHMPEHLICSSCYQSLKPLSDDIKKRYMYVQASIVDYKEAFTYWEKNVSSA